MLYCLSVTASHTLWLLLGMSSNTADLASHAICLDTLHDGAREQCQLTCLKVCWCCKARALEHQAWQHRCGAGPKALQALPIYVLCPACLAEVSPGMKNSFWCASRG